MMVMQEPAASRIAGLPLTIQIDEDADMMRCITLGGDEERLSIPLQTLGPDARLSDLASHLSGGDVHNGCCTTSFFDCSGEEVAKPQDIAMKQASGYVLSHVDHLHDFFTTPGVPAINSWLREDTTIDGVLIKKDDFQSRVQAMRAFRRGLPCHWGQKQVMTADRIAEKLGKTEVALAIVEMLLSQGFPHGGAAFRMLAR